MEDRILPKPTLLPKKVKRYCPCRSVLVIEQTRMLECQKCHRAIDPFDYLFKLAKKQDVLDMSVKMMMREKENLVKELENLERQRRNLKARVARAKRK